MPLFVTVVTRDPREIFYRSFRPYFVGGCIASDSRGTRAEVPLFALILLKPFLGLFPSLLGGFRIAGRIIHALRVLCLLFKLFDSMILH